MKKIIISFAALLTVLVAVFMSVGKVEAQSIYLSCQAETDIAVGQGNLTLLAEYNQPVRWVVYARGGMNYLGQPETSQYFIWSGTDLSATGTTSPIVTMKYTSSGQKKMSVTYNTFQKDSVYPYNIIGISKSADCSNAVDVVPVAIHSYPDYNHPGFEILSRNISSQVVDGIPKISATFKVRIQTIEFEDYTFGSKQSPVGGPTYTPFVFDIYRDDSVINNEIEPTITFTQPLGTYTEDNPQDGEAYAMKDGAFRTPSRGGEFDTEITVSFVPPSTGKYTVGLHGIHWFKDYTIHGYADFMSKHHQTRIWATESIAYPSSAPQGCYVFNTNLTIGSTGPDVVALQTLLISKGFYIAGVSEGSVAKGYLGQATAYAVARYQYSKGISSTGFVGPLTRVALNAESCTGTPTTPIPTSALQVQLTSHNSAATQDLSKAVFDYKVKVAAIGQNIVIPRKVTPANAVDKGGFLYSVISGSGQISGALVTASSLSPRDTNDLFFVAQGESREFNIQIVFAASQDSYAQVELSDMRWINNDVPTSTVQQPYHLGYKSNYVYLKAPQNQNSCPTLTIDGVQYSLDPCTIDLSMVDGAGNTNFSVNIVQKSASGAKTYGFTVYGYGEGLPTYSILGTSSGGAYGNQKIDLYLNDNVLNANGTSAGTYKGTLPIRISHNSYWPASQTLNFGVGITVKPANTPVPPPQPNLPPVIKGSSAPTTLKVGQTGTWSVQASDPENGQLSYSVDWGEAAIASVASNYVQTASFTHSYAKSGTYTVTITVKDSAGNAAKTTATVKVEAVANASISANLVKTSGTIIKAESSIYADVGDYEIRFSVTAHNGDVYIPRGIGMSASDKTGVVYSINGGTAKTVVPLFQTVALQASDTSSYFVVNNGTTREFAVSANLEPIQSGMYSLSLNAIRWKQSPSDLLSQTTNVSFKSDYLALFVKSTPTTTAPVSTPTPSIARIYTSPTTPGAEMTIYGSNFTSSSIVRIVISEDDDQNPGLVMDQQPTQVTSTSIKFNVPTNISTGLHTVTVVNSADKVSNEMYVQIYASSSLQPRPTMSASLWDSVWQYYFGNSR